MCRLTNVLHSISSSLGGAHTMLAAAKQAVLGIDQLQPVVSTCVCVVTTMHFERKLTADCF